MKQEDKELLIKDLCARLPYGLKIQCIGWDYDHDCEFTIVEELIGINDKFIYTLWRDERHMHSIQEPLSVLDYKPYLRPLSSMTEEEKSEFINCAGYEAEESVNGRHYEYYLKDFVGTQEEPIANVDAIDWLNSHHFDYRGLIEKGLALEALEGMYNINRK